MLAVSYGELGDLYQAEGSGESASIYYRKAIELLGPGAVSPYDRSLLALARAAQGQARRQNPLPDAEASAEQSFGIAVRLVRAYGSNLFFRWALGRAHLGLATLGRPAHGAQALVLGRTLHEEEPSNKNYALLLVQALHLEDAQGQEVCRLATAQMQADPEDVRFLPYQCK